jgi:hypothetical protein
MNGIFTISRHPVSPLREGTTEWTVCQRAQCSLGSSWQRWRSSRCLSSPPLRLFAAYCPRNGGDYQKGVAYPALTSESANGGVRKLRQWDSRHRPVRLEFAALKELDGDGSISGSSTVPGRNVALGGTAWTARHGQGFNLGAVARGHGWRFAQLSVRRFLGLVYRLVALSPVVAVPEGGASGRVGRSTPSLRQLTGYPLHRQLSKTGSTQASTTPAKRSRNYRND